MRLLMMLLCVLLLNQVARGADVVVKFSDEVFEYNHDQAAAGYWVGNLAREKDSTIIAVEISSADVQGFSVQLTGLALGAINAACEQTAITGNSVAFVYKAGAAEFHFAGEISENGQRLTGTCTSPARGDKPERKGTMELARTPRAMTLPTGKAFTGSLKIPNMGELKMSIVLARTPGGNWVGHADVPPQGIFGLPLVNITEDDAGLIYATMPIPTSPARIEAKIEAGHLVGHFKQAMFDLILNFPPDSGYVMTTQKRPQHPKPPFPYETREVKVPTKAGFDLAGTLTYPKQGGPFATLVMITGSGQEDRDETIFGHKPFAVIADFLTRNGYAVLRCDDRGAGSSGGLDTVEKATTRDFADDVIAQVEFLKTQPEVDATRIGLIGHSEGGLIAPIVAVERDDIAFIVLLAGPGVNGQEILQVQGRKLLEAEGMSTEMIEAYSARQQKALSLVARNASDEEIRTEISLMVDEERAALDSAASTQPATQPQSQPDNAGRQQQIDVQMKTLTLPWMKYFLTYDPRPTLAKVKCPVLAMNGTLDLQVWHEQNLPEIEKAIRSGGGDVTIKRYDGRNHLFQPAKTGGISEYANIETTFDQQALDDIVAWLKDKAPASASHGD